MNIKGGMVNINPTLIVAAQAAAPAPDDTPAARAAAQAAAVTTAARAAFGFFLSNSNIIYFSHGTYGIIFKATLNDIILDNDSPYESFEPHLGFTALRTILFKIVFLNEDVLRYEFKMLPQIGSNNNQIFETVTVDSFKNETNIHVDIHEKSYDYGQPICPSVLYSTILTTSSAPVDIVTFSHHLLSTTSLKSDGSESQTTKRIKERIIDLVGRGRISQMGIIGMEFAESYSTLNNILSSTNFSITDKEDCIHMSLYLLIELFKLGYTHGDHHPGNILIDTDYQGYFYGLDGRPLIIDFGRTQLLTKILSIADLSFLEKLYREGKYTDILINLNRIQTHDGINLDDPQYVGLYGFTTGIYDAINKKVKSSALPPDMNQRIFNLLRRHEEATKSLKETRDRTSENRANFQRDPIYPLGHPAPVERSLHIYRDKIGGVIKTKQKTKHKNKNKNKKKGKGKKYNSRKKTNRNTIKNK